MFAGTSTSSKGKESSSHSSSMTSSKCEGVSWTLPSSRVVFVLFPPMCELFKIIYKRNRQKSEARERESEYFFALENANANAREKRAENNNNNSSLG